MSTMREVRITIVYNSAIKIAVIKMVRAITGMGLRDSKDLVERYLPDHDWREIRELEQEPTMRTFSLTLSTDAPESQVSKACEEFCSHRARVVEVSYLNNTSTDCIKILEDDVNRASINLTIGANKLVVESIDRSLIGDAIQNFVDFIE